MILLRKCADSMMLQLWRFSYPPSLLPLLRLQSQVPAQIKMVKIVVVVVHSRMTITTMPNKSSEIPFHDDDDVDDDDDDDND